MKYLMGLGEYGIAELFGSTAVCALYVPIGCVPFIRKAYKDMIGASIDDYQVFAIVKDIFPNYTKNRYNLVDWFMTSHYYEVNDTANDNGTGTMNYMTNAPDFVVDSLNVILSCVYVPEVKYFNDLIEASGRSFGMASYLMVSQTEDLLLMEVNDIYESMESKECGPPERVGDADDSVHPVDQFVVNFLATVISRAAYLSQIQKLELQCHASLPRGVSKEANDFYLSRCVKMDPEEKKHLFKVSFMEEKNVR